MTEKYIELNLNDEKSAKVAEVLGNKTCKKILGLLAEEELSEGDIAKKLKLAANTTNYNIKKLVDAGFIEKTSSFFWSVKGKKIPTYRLANKKIIISTKTSFKGLIASVIAGGVIFGGMKMLMNSLTYGVYEASRQLAAEKSADLIYTAAPAASEAASLMHSVSLWNNVLIWALIGIAAGALGYLIFKKMKGGKNKI